MLYLLLLSAAGRAHGQAGREAGKPAGAPDTQQPHGGMHDCSQPDLPQQEAAFAGQMCQMQSPAHMLACCARCTAALAEWRCPIICSKSHARCMCKSAIVNIQLRIASLAWLRS